MLKCLNWKILLRWILGKTTSKNIYTYYNTVSNNQALSNLKYLLNIYDGWKKENVEGRYAISSDTNDTTYTTVCSTIIKVIDYF